MPKPVPDRPVRPPVKPPGPVPTIKPPTDPKPKPKPRPGERFPYDIKPKLPPIMEEELAEKFGQIGAGTDVIEAFPQLAGLGEELQAKILYSLGASDSLVVKVAGRLGKKVAIDIIKTVARIIGQNALIAIWDYFTVEFMAQLDMVMTTIDIVTTAMMIIDLIPYDMGICDAAAQTCRIERKHHPGHFHTHDCGPHHQCHYTGDRCGHRFTPPHRTMCNWHRHEIYHMVTGHGPWKEIWDDIFGKGSDDDPDKWHDKTCPKMAKKKKAMCELQHTPWYYYCREQQAQIDKNGMGIEGPAPVMAALAARNALKDGHGKDRHERACHAYAQANIDRCKYQVEQWLPICKKTRKILVKMEAEAPDPSNTLVTRKKPSSTSRLAPNTTILELGTTVTNTFTISYPVLNHGNITMMANTSTMTFATVTDWTISNGKTVTPKSTSTFDSLIHIKLPGWPDWPPDDYCKHQGAHLEQDLCRPIEPRLLHAACKSDVKYWQEMCEIRRKRAVEMTKFEKSLCNNEHKEQKPKCKHLPGKHDHENKLCKAYNDAQAFRCKALVEDKFSTTLPGEPMPPSPGQKIKFPDWPKHDSRHKCHHMREHLEKHVCDEQDLPDDWQKYCEKLAKAWFEGCRAARYGKNDTWSVWMGGDGSAPTASGTGTEPETGTAIGTGLAHAGMAITGSWADEGLITGTVSASYSTQKTGLVAEVTTSEGALRTEELTPTSMELQSGAQETGAAFAGLAASETLQVGEPALTGGTPSSVAREAGDA
ncbi:hypothetical protein KVT40_000879 [Elsinoe batatas]|uniref:Uncharacterized protein n=1 Tax=Elsinoe batatas TaxID=2601811 RepID=A0A8K0PN36_9PEZI|nr:hypothetical protein KVT40_000879 [Elsinoe batatas]